MAGKGGKGLLTAKTTAAKRADKDKKKAPSPAPPAPASSSQWPHPPSAQVSGVGQRPRRTAEVLELAGNASKDLKVKRITSCHLQHHRDSVVAGCQWRRSMAGRLKQKSTMPVE